MVVSAYAVTVAIIPIVVTSTRAIEEKEEGVIPLHERKTFK